MSNKMGKVAGGLVGITRSESTRIRWGLTYIDRARLVDDTSDMFGIEGDEDDVRHKELGKNRIKRDDSDAQDLVSILKTFEVFSKECE